MRMLLVCALLAGASVAAAQERTPSPPGAEVYIVSPANGAKVHSPVHVVFGLKGMGIAPAGVKSDNTGHHHLLIDTDVPADLSAPLTANEHIVHFGKGQTETEATRPPANPPLQLVPGTAHPAPPSPPVVSKKITITVLP